MQIERMMGPPAKQHISTLTADQLLGPLNDVERKYAPVRLYAAGPIQIPLPRPRAAIIGSRKASEKALDVASEISKTLAKKKVIIVSGLAEGIDTAGHRAAIDAGGKTLAVLGTPLDPADTQNNALLKAEIMKSHLVVSKLAVAYPTQRR